MVILYNDHHLKDNWKKLGFINHAKGLKSGAFVQVLYVQLLGDRHRELRLRVFQSVSEFKILIQRSLLANKQEAIRLIISTIHAEINLL